MSYDYMHGRENYFSGWYENGTEFMDVTWWYALANLTGGEKGNGWYDGEKKYSWYREHTTLYFGDKSYYYEEYDLGYIYFAVTILTETGDQEDRLKEIVKENDFKDNFYQILKYRLKEYSNYSYYNSFKISRIEFSNTNITIEQRAKNFSIMVGICTGILLFTVVVLKFYDQTEYHKEHMKTIEAQHHAHGEHGHGHGHGHGHDEHGHGHGDGHGHETHDTHGTHGTHGTHKTGGHSHEHTTKTHEDGNNTTKHETGAQDHKTVTTQNETEKDDNKHKHKHETENQIKRKDENNEEKDKTHEKKNDNGNENKKQENMNEQKIKDKNENGKGNGNGLIGKPRTARASRSRSRSRSRDANRRKSSKSNTPQVKPIQQPSIDKENQTNQNISSQNNDNTGNNKDSKDTNEVTESN